MKNEELKDPDFDAWCDKVIEAQEKAKAMMES